MKKFGIGITGDLDIWYNHYLSNDLIKYLQKKEWHPLHCWSRKFDKPAMKCSDGACWWYLNNKKHRVGKPARIWSSGYVEYYENGEKVR